jgi:phosphoglycolate phosphatase
MRFSAAIFDLDGTLIDSLNDIGTSMNNALAAHGLPTHPIERYRQFVGEGVEVLTRKASGDHPTLQPAVLATYRGLYAENLFGHTQPYAGIAELLATLDALPIQLAVLSNKPHVSTQRLVAALFHDVNFGAVYGQRVEVARKPDPAAALIIADDLGVQAQTCVFIGDSAIDMQTANAAGMFAVGVTWGFKTRDELLEFGAHAVIDTPHELLAVLQENDRERA